MANLKLIKELASIKGLTIDELAGKAQVSTQAIHLMGRSGKTKMETLEKIANILEVPAYVFFDDKFDVKMFRDYVVQGHHNPTSFFGPIYYGDDASFWMDETEAAIGSLPEIKKTRPRETEGIISAKDETIGVLRKQVEDLLSDKSEMRSEIQTLKAEIASLKEKLKKQKEKLQVNLQAIKKQ